jgi:hypothetical protein
MKTMKLNTTLAAMTLAAMTLAAMAGTAALAADATLDRGGLLKLADTYLGALVAHDPGRCRSPAM